MRWDMNNFLVLVRGTSWGFCTAPHAQPCSEGALSGSWSGKIEQGSQATEWCNVRQETTLCPFAMPEYTHLGGGVFICDSSIWEVDAGGLPKLPGHLDRHSENQASLSYMARSGVSKNKQTKITRRLKQRVYIHTSVWRFGDCVIKCRDRATHARGGVEYCLGI